MLGSFTYVDIALVVLVLIMLIVGLVKGFISQVFGVIGGLAALIVAALFCKQVTELVLPIAQPLIDKVGDTLGYYATLIIVFALLAFLVNLVVLILKNLFQKLTEIGPIKAVDKILGMALSVGMLYLIVSVLLALITIIPTDFMPEVQAVIDEQVNGGVVTKYLTGDNNFFGNWVLSLIMQPA